MLKTPRSLAYASFSAGSIACIAALTHFAEAFFLPTQPVPVYEYYNATTGHYFVTAFTDEGTAIEAGAAGPGWVRTGYTFLAQPSYSTYCVDGCPDQVSRFYAPGPNTHFFTVDPAEAASLKQPGSGWIFEGYGFRAERPNAQGVCNAPYIPVYRLYNNRFAFNDSNHRFVTREDERVRMRAKGWVDEGLKFCVQGAAETTIKSFAFSSLYVDPKIQPSSVCEDESRNLGPCMAVNNLSAPTTPVPFDTGVSPFVYGDVTGLNYAKPFIAGEIPDAAAAANVFVQVAQPWTYGIHVDTVQRGPATFTSVNPLYQFKTTVNAGGADHRFFPFTRAYETDAELSVKFVANVRKVNVRSAGSQAYGHPTLEFIDQRSGRHLYFTTLTYGTINGGDFVAPDVATGKVIVATTFRNDSPYIRNLATWTFATPSDFTPENPWGRGGPFEYRMDRTEFARVIAAARSADPALSTAPEDYMLDNFHFNNEVYGDGEIGMNLAGFRLEILRK